MSIIKSSINFPPVETADEDGFLCAGGDLEIETLLHAYGSGIFPWPHPPIRQILWFAPPERAILEFSRFHLSRRDKQILKKASFTFTVGADFEAVIRACSKVPRPGQNGTWITQEMIRAYIRLHQAGYAQSFETWSEKGELVGGLYGVLIKKVFSAESMFHTKANASKFALVEAVEYLKAAGLTWMDIQVMTPHMERFGARLISRRDFLRKIS